MKNRRSKVDQRASKRIPSAEKKEQKRLLASNGVLAISLTTSNLITKKNGRQRKTAYEAKLPNPSNFKHTLTPFKESLFR